MRVTLTSPVVDRHPNDEMKKSVEELVFDRTNALTFININSWSEMRATSWNSVHLQVHVPNIRHCERIANPRRHGSFFAGDISFLQTFSR
jgi:hypothetical protein